MTLRDELIVHEDRLRELIASAEAANEVLVAAALKELLVRRATDQVVRRELRAFFGDQEGERMAVEHMAKRKPRP